uniref:Ig-like domain-containing protein n=1 Tax=Apteryx owenii TaxID=8824 RepID=A0A8B9P7P5_APTOW
MLSTMVPWLLAWSFTVVPAGVGAQVRLVEAGGGLRASGDAVNLSCHGSGYNFETFAVHWYRQSPGDRPEWVSYISSDSSFIQHMPALEGRATTSRDNPRAEAFLSLHALHPQDSARYFCAITTVTGKPSELKHKPLAGAPPLRSLSVLSSNRKCRSNTTVSAFYGGQSSAPRHGPFQITSGTTGNSG